MTAAATLSAGDSAPTFTLPNQNGETWSLADHRGQHILLYFYPKDMTSGCTVQAEALAAAHDKLQAQGYVVIGVSKDAPARHLKFIAKHDLPFTLLSDEDAAVCELYGVYKEKNMYGNKYMGIERSTFLIDPEGKLIHVARKVSSSKHLEALQPHIEV